MSALEQRWTAALADVIVQQGPVVSTATALEGVSVGYQDATTESVEWAFTPEGVRSVPMREQYTVNCLIVARNGSKDAVAAQARVVELLGLIQADLAADHRLGDLVLDAHVGTAALFPTQVSTGANARLAFGVGIDAYTT